MKHFLAAVSMIISTAASPALAEDAPEIDEGATVGIDPGFTASTGAETGLETLMEAIRAGKTNIGAIESLSAVGKVQVVRVGSLSNGNAAGQLEQAISENQADITALQGVVGGNPALKAELDASEVAVSDVVAAKVEADGSLTVYAR